MKESAVVCNRCAAEIPEGSQYCARCGSATMKAWPLYAAVSLGVAVIGLLLAVKAMEYAAQFVRTLSQADAVRAFDSANGAVGVVWVIVLAFIGIAFQRAWVALLKLEPEIVPHFKRKHRKFQVLAAAILILAVAVAINWGILIGRR